VIYAILAGVLPAIITIIPCLGVCFADRGIEAAN